jgi:Mannosyltransferase (PIG-V)
MQGSKAAWKEAAWIFGLSRLVILLVSSIGIVLLPQAGQTLPNACKVSFDPCFTAWYRWDAIAYVYIAHHGYTYIPDTAFFPFWPLFEHFGGILLGNSLYYRHEGERRITVKTELASRWLNTLAFKLTYKHNVFIIVASSRFAVS